MRFDQTKNLYSYWLNLKGTRKAPDRSEIEPGDIRELLGDTFILEVNHEAKYIIYRLAGTRLCATHGKELKGVGFLVQWSEEDNIKVLQAVRDTYNNFTPNVIGHLGHTEQQRFLEFETLLLPLLPIRDGTSRILGITTPKHEPFWMGNEPVTLHSLRSVRSLMQERNRFRSEHIMEAPALQPDTGDLSMINNNKPRRVAHLTVLEGGRTD